MAPHHHDQEHEDAVAEQKEMHAANPFSLTNVLIYIAITIGLGMGAFIFDKIVKGQESTQEQMSQMHDVLLAHGWVITNVQSDMAELKTANQQMLRKSYFDHVMNELAGKVGAFNGYTGDGYYYNKNSTATIPSLPPVSKIP